MTQFSVPWQPRPPHPYGLASRAVIALAQSVYHIAAPIVSRFPGPILISAVIGTCVVVWMHALLFGWVDVHLIQAAAALPDYAPAALSLISPSTWGLSPSVIHSLRVDGSLAHGVAGLLDYALWPVQFWIVRDLVGLGALFGLFNVIPVYVIWWERKVAGRIQSRLGPMRVGGWHGWAQSPADGIKLILKEDLIPEGADVPLFRLAPYLTIIPSFLAFLALPFGATYVLRELDVALIFILGVLGVEVVGVILAGWASNNKWSIYGAMREACQMISYEIPMGMALLVPVICVGTLNLSAIADAQTGGWFSWIAFSNPFCFVAFVCYFIAALASLKRAPFDLPEAESELVAGFLTEYSGFRWSLFFFAEYAAMFVICALASIVFLGGWHSPLPASWGAGLGDGVLARGLTGILFSGPIWLMFKSVFLLYVQLWLRWTLPRIRIDQVLYACIQVLLPLTMVLVFGATVWTWASTSDSTLWSTIEAVTRVILGSVGLLFIGGFIAIAGYGFYHRRRLVGSLVQDAMPGS